MNAVTVWWVLRVLRWALWLATLGYYAHFIAFRASHLTPFGHLLTTTELFMFGLPTAAVFVGFLEVGAREQAGLPRPSLFRSASNAGSSSKTLPR